MSQAANERRVLPGKEAESGHRAWPGLTSLESCGPQLSCLQAMHRISEKPSTCRHSSAPSIGSPEYPPA